MPCCVGREFGNSKLWDPSLLLMVVMEALQECFICLLIGYLVLG